MEVGRSEHLSRPWRVHEIASGFRVEDVWRFPGTGTAAGFERLVSGIGSYEPLQSSSPVVRTLFWARQQLGEVLRWDEQLDDRPSLADRLPPDLRDSGSDLSSLPFRQLYRTEDEWAAESANKTMHGILHLGRVPAGSDRYFAQLAVLVKPNGVLGEAYMAVIRPFRHLLLYPRLLEGAELGWRPSGTTHSAGCTVTG